MGMRWSSASSFHAHHCFSNKLFARSNDKKMRINRTPLFLEILFLSVVEARFGGYVGGYTDSYGNNWGRHYSSQKVRLKSFKIFEFVSSKKIFYYVSLFLKRKCLGLD